MQPLSWTKKLGLKCCVFKIDANTLIDACKGVQGCAYFHTIVSVYIKLFKYFDDVLVEFVPKFTNG